MIFVRLDILMLCEVYEKQRLCRRYRSDIYRFDGEKR